MPSNTATVDVAAVMTNSSVQGSALVRELPTLAAHLEASAVALKESADELEAAQIEHARACESTGIRADEIYARDLEQRHRSSDIALVRDSRLQFDRSHAVYSATRDAMAQAYRHALAEPDVLAAISLAYGAAADRLDEIVKRQASTLSQMKGLDGAINVALREDLKLAGAPASTVTNDVMMDQPDRVSARARSRAQAIAEMADR